jgi:hypothetical protein
MKKYFFSLFAGGIANYGYFLLIPELIPVYILHLIYENNPIGITYILGFHYPWLWSTILLTFQEFLNKKTNPHFKYDLYIATKRGVFGNSNRI